MKVTDIIASRSDDDAPYYTFEIFPPKTAQGTANLLARVDRMIHTLHPSWVHVTWSAGGTTSEKSLDLAKAAKDLGVEVCVHLTCTNMHTAKLDETLDTLKQLGIQNVLALRGDAPRGEEYWVASDPRFKHGSDLVQYIREKYGDYFCIGVAGYPEGHCDSSDKTSDVKYLLDKQNAGADFVITQLFYDTEAFGKWLEDAKSRGLRIPVLPGIMPIQTFQGFSRITHMCRTFIPDSVIQRLEPIKGDDLAVKDYGVELAVDMIQDLWQEGIRGFHFCTLNLEKSVQRILENLDWIAPTERKSRKRAVNGDGSNGQAQDPRLSALRSSSAGGVGDSRRMTDSPASWDEFPNGRFGDARSPAYGDLDGWGVSLKLTPSEALQKWGAPSCNADISQLFVRYLQGTLKAVPWSDEPLRSETNDILPYLVRLNTEKDWWTVGSQPAVDGAPSEDETYGFGPAGGYVFQKSFVEFFCSYDDVVSIQEKAKKAEQESGKRRITFYAGNTESESKSLITNMQAGDANAVTWGVFPGKEIVTTTLIEEMSFTAWKEEAFSIWTEWEHLYPLKTVTRDLLSSLVKDRWLISVVHHDFKDPKGLWDFLLNE